MQERRLKPALIFSVLLHAVMLTVLTLSFEFSVPLPVVENVENNMHVISAVAMIAPEEPAPSLPTPARVHAAQMTPPPPAPLPKPEVTPTPPFQPVINTQRQQAAQLQQHKLQEAIALKALRKKQMAEQKALLEQQLLQDMQKQVAKKPKIKIKPDAIAQSMAKEMQDQAAKNLQQQLLQEQKRAAGAKAQGEVDKYKALILHAISQRWLVPSGTDRNISAELLIRLASDGTVLDAQITRSSGNIALDRSARAAVFKSSPLPVPTDASALDQFRQFVLKMKPENLQRDSSPD